MEDLKIYESTIEGKQDFVNTVLNTIVANEGTFAGCFYVDLKHDEYIQFVQYNREEGPKINITADSIEAIIHDFCRYFPKIINC